MTDQEKGGAGAAASFPLRGEARSSSCGSRLELGMGTGVDDRVERLGLRVQACAIGQASAAVFAEAARGRTLEEICLAAQEMQAWVTGGGPHPDWPGLDLIAAAREYPARHGAMLLAWKAAEHAMAEHGRRC
ncbi:iron-sulfur cluster assembly scaffold protein [Croceicoccus sp. F390]|uniref:Iron-sulfur cluster assembly scaffold protein n=1 Tax=Croceicoccus esteveae TaxID=3075597 RepID=A0ABU2ZIY6_9SPHN|nr:iron-sulfur cluster assembly scaffold protein [Croceicoccus sp. F390]MDT0575534.1 iron-sulfur cluster assembly scaffold protein [Croceicoccus sp. F390]